METRVVTVDLPNGTTALVRAVDADADADAGGTEKGLVVERFDFNGVAATLEGVAEAVKAAVAKVAPDRVTLELGIELAVKSGRLTGLLVEGAGKGSLAVTLEWVPKAPPPG